MTNEATFIRVPKIVQQSAGVFIILCALFVSGDMLYRLYYAFASLKAAPSNILFALGMILIMAAFAIYQVLISLFYSPDNIQKHISLPDPQKDPLVDRLNEFRRAEQSSSDSVVDRPIFPDNGLCPYCRDKIERSQDAGFVIASCQLCKRTFSNVGPVLIDGKIKIIKYDDSSLKEMIPVPLN